MRSVFALEMPGGKSYTNDKNRERTALLITTTLPTTSETVCFVNIDAFASDLNYIQAKKKGHQQEIASWSTGTLLGIGLQIEPTQLIVPSLWLLPFP
jgi:hypothetical protein